MLKRSRISLILGLCIALAGAAQATIVESDLVAYWELDGNLTDSIGGYNGTFVDRSAGGLEIAYGTGFNGTANGGVDFSIDGISRYDSIETDLVIPTGPKSVSMFFTTTRGQDPRFQALAGGKSDDSIFAIYAHYYGDGRLTGNCGNTDHSRSGQPSVNYSPLGTDLATNDTYHLVVLTDDGAGNWNMYYRSPSDSGVIAIDTSVVDTTYTGTTADGAKFFIGNCSVLGSNPGFVASGRIDDVAFFNRIITLEEAESIWAAGSVAELIPEPATISLLVSGAMGLMLRRKRA